MNKRLVCLVLTCAALAVAQTRSISLREAVRIALEGNPDVLLARIEHEKAAASAEVARAAFSPYAAVGSGLGWTSGIPQSIEGATPSVVQATARKTVYNRELQGHAREAEALAEAARHEAAAHEDEVAYRAASAWLDLDRAVRAVEMAEQQVRNFERIAQALASRVEDGRAIPLEGSRARLDLARAEQQLELRRSEADVAQASLRNLLGLASTEKLAPAAGESLPPLTLPESAEAGAARAQESSDELRSLESKVTASELAVRAEKGAKAPRLDFVAQYSLLAKFNNYEEFFNRFQRHNGQVGMALSVPVFTGKSVSSRVARASIAEREARLQLEAREAGIELETYQLYRRAEQAQAAQKLARLELDFARESLSVTLAQFEEGRAAVDAVERSRVEEAQAWERYYDAKLDLEKAQLNLLRRTGDLAAALR
ncbi:MAG: TolC family protein [Bryobacterales bacterium]|nr:TolC family protein [Acidobacteriota bacterium]MCB9383076.1 TolC family protein [Bryobacterales bacterium]